MLRFLVFLNFVLSASGSCGKEGLPFHRGMYIVENTKTSDQSQDRPRATLPPGLVIKPSSVPKAGLGVWSERYFPKGTRFGPYDGVIMKKIKKWAYAWNVYDENFKFKHYVDAFHANQSNWLRYVNDPSNVEQENLYLYQYNDQIYYVTYECIKPGTELMIWYGPNYGKTLGLHRTKQDYQKRFHEDGVRYVIENSISDNVTQIHKRCYKFYNGRPFRKPPGKNGKYDKYCTKDEGYRVCKYNTCQLNPCTRQNDCRNCKGYCRHLGKYYKSEEEFSHTDRSNTCKCRKDGHFGCTTKRQSMSTMCY